MTEEDEQFMLDNLVTFFIAGEFLQISALMFKMLCDRPSSCSSHSYVMVTIFSVNFYIIVFIGKFCSSYSQHAYNAN